MPGRGTVRFPVRVRRNRARSSRQFTLTTALIFGETQNQNSQIPGRISDTEGFYDSHYYHYGYWTEFAGTVYSSIPSWGGYDGPYYGTTFYIWDKACA